MARKILGAGLVAASLCFAFLADDDPQKLPDGPDKELVIRVCTDCHGTSNFRKMRLDRDAWADEVADMKDRGADGTDAEMAAVTEYLVEHFGKDSKVNVNTAPISELKAILGLTVPEAQALIAYRDANGKFKELSDLQKVQGLDQAKLEAKKNLLAF